MLRVLGLTLSATTVLVIIKPTFLCAALFLGLQFFWVLLLRNLIVKFAFKSPDSNSKSILHPFILWVVVLLLCGFFEYFVLTNSVNALTFGNLCGNVCYSELSSTCMACKSSIITVWVLITLTALLVDTMMFFYVIIGFFQWFSGSFDGIRTKNYILRDADVKPIPIETLEIVLKDFYERDLIDDREKQQIMALHPDGLSPKKGSFLDLSQFLDEAREKILWFVHTYTDPPDLSFKSLTQIIPHYIERVMWDKTELDESSLGALTPLQQLKCSYQREWKNFQKRFKDNNKEPEDQDIEMWATCRTQCLGRTIRGMISYTSALGHVCEDQTQAAKLYQLVIGSQIMDQRPDFKQKLEKVLNYFLKEEKNTVSVYVVSDKREKENNITSVYQYKQATSKLDSIWEFPRTFPLLLGKNTQTQGKTANQTNCLKVAFGDVIQTMDMNMDMTVSEHLKLIPLLNEVNSEKPIMGFRERIYTVNSGLVGQIFGLSDFAFASIFQREITNLGQRMHYGHPDIFQANYIYTSGGLSKGSKTINLSEDFFQGLNCRLRGKTSGFGDHLEAEKGREETFISVSSFIAKTSSGSVGILRSRDMARYSLQLNILDQASLFYTSVGYYIVQYVLTTTVYLYLATFILLGFSGIGLKSLGQLHNTLAVEWVISLGSLSAIPLLVELVHLYGFGTGLIKFIQNLIPSALFWMFHSKVASNAFITAIVSGKASYISTNRPPFWTPTKKTEAYKAWVISHYYPAVLIFYLYVLYYAVTDSENGRLPMVYSKFFNLLQIIARSGLRLTSIL